MFSFLFNFIDGSVGSIAILSLSIIIGTLFLEDATSVVVGMLAADGVIPIPLAILSLYTGVIAGDFGFYFLGWLASKHRRLACYVDHVCTAPFRIWLETRFVLAVFSARFIPGTRFATYAASGFFRSPFASFAGTAIVATSIWITFLFFASYWFGSATSEWLGPARWGIAFVFLFTLFFVGRHNLRAYRSGGKNDCIK
jgi:membrane protein DedA with SNARE-associated domain